MIYNFYYHQISVAQDRNTITLQFLTYYHHHFLYSLWSWFFTLIPCHPAPHKTTHMFNMFFRKYTHIHSHTYGCFLSLWICGRKWRGTKKPLDESERGEWKSWLKAQHSENSDHGIWFHHFIGNRWGNSGISVRLYFFGAPKSLQMVTAAMKLKDAYSLEGKLWPT